jgi:tetratricopeptide (TPR) repeat protein
MSDENVTFTLKQGLVESENCLAKMEDVLPNTQHVGFVVDTKTSGALVAFYDNVTGWISSKELNSGNSGRYTDPQGYFFKGQVVTVWILGLKDGKIQLSLNCPTAKKKRIKLGEVVDATIKKITSSGLKVEAGPHKAAATVPLAHLCETLSVCPLLLKTYQRGQQLTNLMCVRNTPSVVLSRREALAHEKNSTKIPELHNLKKNMLLRCSFESSCDSGIYVFAPIKNYYKNIFVLRKNVVSKVWPPTFEEEQLILATVLKVNYKAKKIDLAIEYDDVRDQGVDTLLNSLSSTIEDLHYIVDLHQENHMKLTEYKIGERVQCQIKKIDSDGNYKVTLPNGTKGSVASHLSSPNPVGSVVEGVVLDFNFGGGYVEICTKTNIKQKINKVQSKCKVIPNEMVSLNCMILDGVAQKSFYSSCVARILLVTKLYVLGILKDTQCNRQLVYLPVGCTEQEKILHNDKLKVVIHRRIHSKIIGVPKKCGTVEKDIDIEDKPKRKRKKTKVSDVSKDVPAECELLESEKEETHVKFGETEETNGEFSETEETNEEFSETEEANGEFSETEEINGEFSETEEINGGFSETDEINGEFRETEEINGEFSKTEKHNSDQEMDSDSENATSADRSDHVSSDNSNIKKRGALLSGARSFYGADDDKVKDESSSDEEEESESKKSKKTVPAKKSEMIKLEEERIAKIEKELADSIAKPQTAEQFDRLLLASPNSSELWLQYMAMHVAAAELEKARVIGKKAIETINMTLTKEKFNVWIAFLNLENMYGTKESFENIFEDAVKYNDSLDVYLSVIKMLASAGKLVEMEEKIKKVKSKHKQNTKMWLELGQVYYSLGKFREARNIKEAALKSILDKKRQFDLIVRFGTMEFQFGELEQAIANFETILDTYPHKTTIWIIYVDQLVKQEKYETAREVLERAVSLKLGVRAMKSLFQKFIHFEEQHGTAETVEEVKKRARDYVENLGVN